MSEIIEGVAEIQTRAAANNITYEPNRVVSCKFAKDLGFTPNSSYPTNDTKCITEGNADRNGYFTDLRYITFANDNKYITQDNICTYSPKQLTISKNGTMSTPCNITNNATTLIPSASNQVIDGSDIQYNAGMIFPGTTTQGAIFKINLNTRTNLTNVSGIKFEVSNYYFQSNTAYNTTLLTIGSNRSFTGRGIYIGGIQSNLSIYAGSYPYNPSQKQGFWTAIYPTRCSLIQYNKSISNVSLLLYRNISNNYSWWRFNNSSLYSYQDQHTLDWDLNDYINLNNLYICIGNSGLKSDRPFKGSTGLIKLTFYITPIGSIGLTIPSFT